VARDPLIEVLKSTSAQTSRAEIDLRKLSGELQRICDMLWKVRMKRIFGQKLGTGWIEQVPETWFLISGSKNI
jgi:hypothetical protein